MSVVKCAFCPFEDEKNKMWEIDGAKYYFCHDCFMRKNKREQPVIVETVAVKKPVIVDDTLRCLKCKKELCITNTYRIDSKPHCSDCAWEEHKKGTYKSFYPPEMPVEKKVDTLGKKWLIDENLRKKDRSMEKPDCLTTLDVLPKGSPDADIIRKARELGLIIVTKDIRLTLNCIIRGQEVVFEDFHGNRHHIRRSVDNG